MPEYGLCDKSPEQFEAERAREQFQQEWIATTRHVEAKEVKAAQRKADAETGSIQTAEILRIMMEQMHEIHDMQEAERHARIDAEKRTAATSRKQAKENRIWQVTGVTIGLLTLGATVLFGILGLLR